MKRKSIEEATASDLRQFGAVVLGIEIHGTENKPTMIAKFGEAGHTADWITVQDETAVPSGARTPNSPFAKREGKDGETEVQIQIHASDRPGGDQPVPVGVNGRMMLIPRGKPVWVPEKYVEVLDHAQEDTYDEYTEGLGGLSAARSVQAYPFSYV